MTRVPWTILIRAPIRGLLNIILSISQCPLVVNVRSRMNFYLHCGDAVSDVTSLMSEDHSGYTYISTCPLFQINPPSPPFPKRSNPPERKIPRGRGSRTRNPSFGFITSGSLNLRNNCNTIATNVDADPHFATCDFPASFGESRTTGLRVRVLCLVGGAIAYGIVSSLGIVGSIVGTWVMSFMIGVVTFAGGGSFRVGVGSMMGCDGDIRHVGFSFGGATRSC